MFLLDTNIVSERIKNRPHVPLIHWMDNTPNDQQFLSVLTLGEIRKGIERFAVPAKKQVLIQWLEHELPERFASTILPVDRNVADAWGKILARSARTLPVVDALLAATALTHRLTIVTRNSRDFDYPGLRTFNPWES